MTRFMIDYHVWARTIWVHFFPASIKLSQGRRNDDGQKLGTTFILSDQITFGITKRVKTLFHKKMQKCMLST